MKQPSVTNYKGKDFLSFLPFGINSFILKVLIFNTFEMLKKKLPGYYFFLMSALIRHKKLLLYF